MTGRIASSRRCSWAAVCCFVAMLFVGAAIAGGLLADTSIPAGQAASTELWALQRRITFTIINVYAIRRALLVFILSTTMIGVRTRTIPRWLAVVGFVAPAIILFGVTISPLLNLVCPCGLSSSARTSSFKSRTGR